MQAGRTALVTAAVTGQSECVRLLLEAGADTEAEDNVRGACLLFFFVIRRSCCCPLVRDFSLDTFSLYQPMQLS